MGFFSSRKSEDNDGYVITALGSSANEKSVVNVIRSRFYGKHKGKEREDRTPQSFHTHGASPAQTLSGPSSSTPPRASTPSAHLKNNPTGSPRIPHHGRSSPANSSRDDKMDNTIMASPSPTPKLRGAASAERKSPRPSSLAQQAPRKATDAASMTLAQRLNELAMANSEGLLKFSSSAVVPTEEPLVPVSRHRQRANTDTPTDSRSTTRPLSNFQIDAPRTPSLQSKISTPSGIPGFLRRATSKRTPTRDPNTNTSDASSVFSSTSAQSRIFKLPRGLSKKSSSSSIVTQTDAMSVSSRRTGIGSDRSHSEHNAYGTSYFNSPSHSRSTTSSVRRFATPPSSFPTRVPGGEARYTGKVTDTAQQIREEILSVEAEARRLMDAFSGLELTTLARLQRREGGPDEGGVAESTWTLVPENRSQRRIKYVTSQEKRTPKTAGAMPPPPSPRCRTPGRTIWLGMGRMRAWSRVSIAHMDDIRRRREEVRIRYEARLEYLRAKLKGAQLHENC
ncbi:hypothetical protein BD779DRAFT_1498541 [Infundibulicybe gibba]|nr:hypothetical protein BD779DRAFT_1498541 [Infundibulicybe gibba]